MGRQASSQASWALLTEGVTAAKLEAHRLRHLSNRGIRLVDTSPERDHIYQMAGDIISALPDRLGRLDAALDRVSYALSKMGQEFFESKLSMGDKMLVDEAIESSSFTKKPQKKSEKRVVDRFIERRSQG